MSSKAEFESVIAAIRGFRIPNDTEAAMQKTIQQVLEKFGIEHAREVVLGETDRIDFLVGSIGIECKVAGSFSSVAEQCGRYLENSRVNFLILVTSRASHKRICYDCGKPFQVLVVSGF
jgi:hypothetical protein